MRHSPSLRPAARRRRSRPRSSHPLAPRRRASRAASPLPPALMLHLSPRDRQLGKRRAAKSRRAARGGWRKKKSAAQRAAACCQAQICVTGVPVEAILQEYGRAADLAARRRALQIVGDGAERSRQIGADGAENGDGGNRDQSSNETVLDGGSAVIITQQTIKESHLHSPGPS